MMNPVVLSIHYQAPRDDPKVVECVIIETSNGPKPYCRVWMNQVPPLVEWGWTLGDFSEKCWEETPE